MADPVAGPQQPQRGADPSKVIARLAQQVGDVTQQLAIASVMVEDLTAENDGLRAELVRLSSGTEPQPD